MISDGRTNEVADRPGIIHLKLTLSHADNGTALNCKSNYSPHFLRAGRQAPEAIHDILHELLDDILLESAQ